MKKLFKRLKKISAGLLVLGAVSGALPGWAKNISANITLTQDEDWSAEGDLAFTVAGKTVDLAGHKLTILKSQNDANISGTITSSQAGGELHVIVNSGRVRNQYVSITGTLDFYKEGAGAYWVNAQSPFKGTAYIRQGTFFSGGNNNFGTGDIYIANGAAFDFNSTVTWHTRKFILEGGTLKNSVAVDVTKGFGFYTQVADVRLEADSTIDFAALSHGFVNTGYKALTIALQGHVLNLTPNGGTYGCCNATFPQGTVNQHGDMIFFNRASTATDATFNSYNPLILSNSVNVTFGDFVNHATTDTASYNAAIFSSGNVYITRSFKPVGDCFRGCTLKSGATLDLRDRAGCWSTTSTTLRTQVPHELLFESGAVITVDVTGRTFAAGDQIVSWSTRPVNVTFLSPAAVAEAGIAFEVRDDGLYCTKPIVSAVWTGQGDPENPLDSANWICYDGDEQQVADAVPTPDTTVRLTNAALFNVSTNKSLTVKSLAASATITLPADIDWRGLAVIRPSPVTIDLNGHNLRISGSKENVYSDASGVQCQEVEYIEATGTQHIDTGYTLLEADVVETTVNVPNSQPQSFSMLFGACGNSHWYWVGLRNGSCLPRYKRASSSVDGTANDATFFNKKIDINCSGKTMKWRDANTVSWPQSLTVGTLTGDCDRSCYIFHEHDSDNGNYHSKGKLYSFTITSGGTVKRDLVPVKRVSDGVYGLVDRANGNNWYGNAGTGSFTGGGVMTKYPTIGTITDSSGSVGGELHIDVPAGQTYTTAGLTLAGGVKVVKEGTGVLDFARMNQLFTGGVVVEAGTIMTSAGSATGSWAFGGNGVANATAQSITLNSGTTLDLNGKGGWGYATITLNGGRIYGYSSQLNAALKLTADSSFVITDHSSTLAGTLDLGGKKLTVSLALGKSWNLGHATITKGTIDVTSGGWLVFNRANLNAQEVDFKVTAALNVAATASIHDCWSCYTGDYNKGTAALKVFGKFTTPSTVGKKYFYGATLQNGATIDLANQTGAWSTTSDFSGTSESNKGLKTVTFADNATITIDFGSRKVEDGEKLVAWDEAPTNLSGLRFRLPAGVKGAVSARSDGVYYYYSGLVLTVR